MDAFNSDAFGSIDWDSITSVEQRDSALRSLGGTGIAVFGVGLIISLIACFFGYKLMKIFIAFGGFCIGGAVGVVIASHMTKSSPVVLLVGLICGVLLAMAAYKLYKIGVFLMAFSNAFPIPLAVITGVSGEKAVPEDMAKIGFAAGILFGILIGIVAVIFTKPSIILSTSIENGLSAGVFLACMISKVSLFLLLGGIFAVLGTIIQVKTNHGFLEHKEKDKSVPPSQGGAPVG